MPSVGFGALLIYGGLDLGKSDNDWEPLVPPEELERAVELAMEGLIEFDGKDAVHVLLSLDESGVSDPLARRLVELTPIICTRYIYANTGVNFPDEFHVPRYPGRVSSFRFNDDPICRAILSYIETRCPKIEGALLSSIASRSVDFQMIQEVVENKAELEQFKIASPFMSG
jgi:hypothetical protein